MGISFAFDGDDVVWTQRFERPAVYLDTFAIREIAESDELSARFARALKAKGGTWLLASISMGEFARFADPRHGQCAEALLALTVPNIYLFLSEPADLREQRADADPEERQFPLSDQRNMDYFARKWAKAKDIKATFAGMFQMVHEHRVQMAETLDEVATKLVASLTHHRQSDEYRRKAKVSHPADGRTRQRIISSDLLRELILNTNSSVGTNEVLDLMHAVEAVDYCDLVLLDKAWERRVNALHQRIADAGVTMPVATCYSKSNGGIERFLEALEQWPVSGNRGCV